MGLKTELARKAVKKMAELVRIMVGPGGEPKKEVAARPAKTETTPRAMLQTTIERI